MSELVTQKFIEELQRSKPDERNAMCEYVMWRWQQSYYDDELSFEEFSAAVEKMRSMNFIARAKEN